MTFSENRTIRGPTTWYSVEDVALKESTLYYRLGPPLRLRDGDGWRRDARDRVALEAFAALPLEAMSENLRADTRMGSSAVAEVLPELVSLVATFGPIDVDGSRTFDVENKEAEALRHKVDGLERRSLGLTKRAPVPTRLHWQLTFPAPATLGLPWVHSTRTDRDRSWEQRVQARDEGLVHDWLGEAGPFWTAYEDLHHALALTDALANGNPAEVRRCLEARYPWVLELYEPGDDAHPLGLDWRKSLLPGRDAPSPFGAPEKFDWLVRGWITLAATIDRQLIWTTPRVALDSRNRTRLEWQVGSLLEVIYLQLLEQVQERPKLGIGTCGFCGGPILNVRKDQHWHAPACASAGRKRRSRANQAALHEGMAR